MVEQVRFKKGTLCLMRPAQKHVLYLRHWLSEACHEPQHPWDRIRVQAP